jgi:hypothetical protein
MLIHSNLEILFITNTTGASSSTKLNDEWDKIMVPKGAADAELAGTDDQTDETVLSSPKTLSPAGKCFQMMCLTAK